MCRGYFGALNQYIGDCNARNHRRGNRAGHARNRYHGSQVMTWGLALAFIAVMFVGAYGLALWLLGVVGKAFQDGDWWQ